MGYCINQTDSFFEIAADKKAAALQAVKDLNKLGHERGGGFNSFGGKVTKHWSWVSSEEVDEAGTLEEALQAWRWEAETDEDGNITDIYFAGEKLGDDYELFSVLAPFVTPGCYVAMTGEDGAIWRWLMGPDGCEEQPGRITFG